MGNAIEYVKMALKNIIANKGRSFLTMLGIIIGIMIVETMLRKIKRIPISLGVLQ